LKSDVLQLLKSPLIAGSIAAVVSLVLTPVVKQFAISKGAVDDPTRDDRRVHKEPIPRWGGLAIYAAIVVGTVLAFAISGKQVPLYMWGMLSMSGVLVIVGALDDLYQYKAKVQALILLGAGVIVQFIHAGKPQQISIVGFSNPLNDSYVPLGLAAIPITAIYIFVVTKTMDTIDGIDGLTAGVATIAATALCLIGIYQGYSNMGIAAAAIAGASLGFLRHNFNPAKIFMGTGGAYVLGFSLACLSVVGTLKTIFMPMLIFGLPIFDAVIVVSRRILSGVPITQADKRHLHHELLGRGLSQRQAVLVLYTAAALLCAAGLLVMRLTSLKK
jgi:UDP-GlcNAc:undecaprenyl-phosphate/decaprenyl-phosphate GlcNAc-1-phosphate transferase